MMGASRTPSLTAYSGMVKNTITRILPIGARVELLRIGRYIENIPYRNRFAITRGEVQKFEHILDEKYSPLERVKGAVEPRLQKGKERNVAIAAKKINATVIKPGEIFSYHQLVGRPSWLKGFRSGLQLLRDEESKGIGGGLCQISNMLYQLAAGSGMLIVERHRHGLDLFPDHVRTAPFGCGATVRYNYNDLRFENPLPYPVIVNLEIEYDRLRGAIAAPCEPDFKVIIEERDHRFFWENGTRMRENRIYRIITSLDGNLIKEELLAHNRCKVKY